MLLCYSARGTSSDASQHCSILFWFSCYVRVSFPAWVLCTYLATLTYCRFSCYVDVVLCLGSLHVPCNTDVLESIAGSSVVSLWQLLHGIFSGAWQMASGRFGFCCYVTVSSFTWDPCLCLATLMHRTSGSAVTRVRACVRACVCVCVCERESFQDLEWMVRSVDFTSQFTYTSYRFVVA